MVVPIKRTVRVAPRQPPGPKGKARVKKFALLIGIEYTQYAASGRLDRLPGCHADVWSMRDILSRRYGYASSEMYVLADSRGYTSPTHANIMGGIRALLNRARSGTKQIVLYYSGHGTQERDRNADESDRYDECMVPCDFLARGMITDDLLARTLLVGLPAGVKLTLISDSCNSGTLYDLPYMYTPQKGFERTRDKRSKTAVKAQVVSLSGCRDPQTSASAYNLQRRRGWRRAMTVALEQAWARWGYSANVQKVVEECRSFLRLNNFSQVPQLCCSTNLSPSKLRFL